MISKQYFEETFSLATAQSLQHWADNNLITATLGDYALKITGNETGSTFGEVLLSPLVVGVECTVSMYFEEIFSNNFSIRINSLPNDNASTILEQGWIDGVGQRSFTFTPTETTMYLAIGDNVGSVGTYSIVDNVKVFNGTTDVMTNGDFEDTTTNPWYAQGTSVVLSSYQYVAPPVDNDYLEPVNIPPYDSGNPLHCMIPDDEPFTSSTFNNASYRNFYVRPSNNTTGIRLSLSGTDIARRTISVENGNDLHPGADTEGNRVYGYIEFDNTNYWTIDRISSKERVQLSGETTSTLMWKGSSYNIINRGYSTNFAQAVIVGRDSNYNTFQRFRYEDQNFDSIMLNDNVCIIMKNIPWGGPANFDIIGNKFLLGEVKNCNDAFQLQISGDGTTEFSNGEGTIVDSCDFYIDSDLYSDFGGTLDPNGVYAYAEDGIDMKGGSTNPNNPIIISNNHIWGYRSTNNAHVSGSDGTCFTVHYGNPTNIHLFDNVLFDSPIAIGFHTKADGGKAERNLIVEPDASVKFREKAYCIYSTGSDNLAIEDNEVFNSTTRPWMYFSGDNNLSAINNTGINLAPESDEIVVIGGSGVTSPNPLVADAVAGGYIYDYTFTTDKYTSSPRQITLENVLKEEQA